MLPIYLFLAALLMAPSVARGQEAEPEGGTTQAEPAAQAPAARIAMPRGSRPQGDNPRIGTAMPRASQAGCRRGLRIGSAGNRNASPVRAEVPARAASAQEQPAPEPERQAVPRGSRPQGDNPRIGTAVPRPSAPPRSGRRESRRTADAPLSCRTAAAPSSSGHRASMATTIRAATTRTHTGRMGTARSASVTSTTTPTGGIPGYAPGFSTYGYYDGYRRPFSSFDIGELRLDVSPRHAQVYVDGYYAGVVDDYDGVFQGLKLESGTYRIEITAPGYEKLSFDVRISPEQKIRYEGNLRRRAVDRPEAYRPPATTSPTTPHPARHADLRRNHT